MMRRPYERCSAVLIASALLALTGCNNEDVPEDDPTVGEATGGDTGDTGDTGETGETGGPEPVACWEPDGYQPVNPSLFQCHGSGGGDLSFIVCEQLNCAGSCSSPGDWTPDSRIAGPFPFPPVPPDTEPDTRACCEYDATTEQTRDGCKADCARAACDIAIQTLQQAYDEADDNPPLLCGSACVERTQDSLQHWIDWLEANYETCVTAALNGQYINLPTAPGLDAKAGALACGKLALDCALDEQTDPVDLETTCSTSHNELLETGELILQCDLDGDIEIDGPQGNDFTTFEGTITLRRESPCTSGSCWFSIDNLEIDADSFAANGYVGRNMRGSLAYQGFGTLDSSTDEGAIATSMFGLEVTMDGSTPTTSLQAYEFRIANSDDALFEITGSTFEIVDAYFAWADHEVVITSDVASCTCMNCSL